MGIRFSINNQYSKYIAPFFIGIPTGYLLYTSIYHPNMLYSKPIKPIKTIKTIETIETIEKIEKNTHIDDNITHSYNYFNNYINNKDNKDNSYLHRILSAPSSVQYDKGLLQNGNIYGEEWKNVYSVSTQYLNNTLSLSGNNLRIYQDIFYNYSFEYDISYANSNNISYILDVITVSITNIKNNSEKYINDSIDSIPKIINNEYDSVSFHPIKISTLTNLLEINKTTCLQYYNNSNIAESPSNISLNNVDTHSSISPKHTDIINTNLELIENKQDNGSGTDTDSIYTDTYPYLNTDLQYDIDSFMSYFPNDNSSNDNSSNDNSSNDNSSKMEDIGNLSHLKSNINDCLFIELFFNKSKLVSIHYKK